MASGISIIQTNGVEVKGKEVKVKSDGVLDEETGMLVKFSDLFNGFSEQYINFSIKVTEKVEDKFEVPDSDTEDDE